MCCAEFFSLLILSSFAIVFSGLYAVVTQCSVGAALQTFAYANRQRSVESLSMQALDKISDILLCGSVSILDPNLIDVQTFSISNLFQMTYNMLLYLAGRHSELLSRILFFYTPQVHRKKLHWLNKYRRRFVNEKSTNSNHKKSMFETI